MKLLTSIFLLVFLIIGFTSSAQEARYIEFWSDTEAEFANPETSPLKKDEVASFDSIARYSYNPDFSVQARFEPLKRQKPFTFETTGAIRQRYQKAGVLHFKIDTTEYELSAYRNLELMRMPGYENHLFVPFTDESNGFGTYEGGRYLDLEFPESDSTLVDFINRPLISIAGMMGGLALGLALFVLLEVLNRAVRRPQDLQAGLGIDVFGTVPYMTTDWEHFRRRTVTLTVSAVLMVGIVGGLWYVDSNISPLQPIMESVLSRLNLSQLL